MGNFFVENDGGVFFSISFFCDKTRVNTKKQQGIVLCQHVQRFTLKFGIRLKTLLCTEERWSFAKVHMQKHGKYQEARA